MLFDSRYEGYNAPLIGIRLPGTRDTRYFQVKLLFTSIRPLSITFATKFYLCSDTYIS